MLTLPDSAISRACYFLSRNSFFFAMLFVMKGIIALDIDGTITVEHHTIPLAVANYLTLLATEGWQFIFITGRTFSWGYEILKTLSFPYYFAVQNGAILIEMPWRRVISKKYLDRSIIIMMDEICQDEPSDFVIYAGFEHRDVCYYRPKCFSTDLLNYLKRRITALKEVWIPVDSYDEMLLDSFASIKCFGQNQSAVHLAEKIEEKLGLHVPYIRDPFDESYFVVQATHPKVNKGQALSDFIIKGGQMGAVIAAGDDYNDLPMLEAADIKVVMATAPKELLQLADVIAPPAAEEGIILGLQEAIRLHREIGK